MTSSIHEASRDGNIVEVKQHLAAGRYVDSEEFGRTSLHWAVKEKHKEIVEMLIANSADVNTENDRVETPLNYSKGEIADLLCKHGGKEGEVRSNWLDKLERLHLNA